MDLLAVAAASFAGGIGWAAIARDTSLLVYQTASGLSALAVFLCARRPRAALPLLGLFFFLLGVVRGLPALQPPAAPDHIANLVTGRKEVVVGGVLQECPLLEEERSRLLMAVESVHPPDGPERPATGLVLLTVNGLPPPGLLPGDRFLARTTLSPVHAAGTPGAFDYQQYLARQGIWLTGWVASPALLLRFGQLPPPPLAERLRYLPERLRYRIGRFLDRELPPEESGVYKAILIGDRSGVAPATIERFNNTGTIHILSISGLHMALLGMLLTGSLGWLLKRSTWLLLRVPVWKLTALLAVPCLGAYALIAGFQAPVARSLVMALLFLLAIVHDRQGSLPTAIGLAALLLLAWRPAQLLDVSFQLTFAAVIAIGLVLPRLRPLLMPDQAAGRAARLGRRLLAALAVSLAAVVGTLPLLLYHFNRFSLVSPFATLAVEPLLCLWGLTLGLLACLALPLSAGAAGLLLKTGALGITAGNRVVALFAALPFCSLWLPTPSFPEMAALLLLPVALLYWRRLPFARLLAVMSLAILAVTPAFHAWSCHRDRAARVTVLDMGQGSSVLVELPGGRTVLVDGGGYGSERFDPGERLIAPYLWRRGISRLDGVAVSHPHADHYNGLSFMIERFRPRVVWTNGRPGEEPEYGQLLKRAAALGIPVRVPAAGEALVAEGDCRLTNLADFLHPHSGRGNPNEESLVLRLDCGKVSFLFPGDIDGETEKGLVTAGADLDVEVLLAAHHGSPGSTDPVFLAAASPRYLAVSVGPSGPLHAAAEGRLAGWRQQGLIPLTTADCGSLFFETDGRTLRTSTYRACPDAAEPTGPLAENTREVL
ncbi:MAG: DNA internalization-related competence protein ComEC/Rec2 [Desulfobacteraceae bacterium]|nr:DNA internalization-related competence protein ComEC/Rec2 [Desulfobacteraceae bacterium]